MSNLQSKSSAPLNKVKIIYGNTASRDSVFNSCTKESEYMDYKVYNGNIMVTYCSEFMVERPMYEDQIKMLGEVLKLELESFIDFKLELGVEYDNYGHCVLLWKTAKKNFDKILEIDSDMSYRNFNTEEMTDFVEEWNSLDEYHIGGYYEDFDTDKEKLETYIKTTLRFKYDIGDAQDIVDATDLDFNFVDNYLKVKSRKAKLLKIGKC